MKKVLFYIDVCTKYHAYSLSKDHYYQHGGLLFHLSFYSE